MASVSIPLFSSSSLIIFWATSIKVSRCLKKLISSSVLNSEYCFRNSSDDCSFIPNQTPLRSLSPLRKISPNNIDQMSLMIQGLKKIIPPKNRLPA